MPTRSDKLQALYEQGEQHSRQGEWKEAVQVFLEIVSSEAGFRDSVNQLKRAQIKKRSQDLLVQGKIAEENKNWQEAIKVCQDILTQDRRCQEAKALLARAKKQQRLQQLFDEGRTFFEQRKWKEAISKFRQIKRGEPDYSEVVRMLEGAQRELELQSLYDQGCAHLAKGRSDKAVVAFRDLQQKAPDRSDIGGRLEEAEKRWKEQQELEELYRKARNCESEEKWEEAKKLYLQILGQEDYKDAARRIGYVTRREKIALGTRARRSFIWERIRAWWLLQSVGDRAGIISVIIALAAIIPAYGIFTLESEEHPVPILVAPGHGKSLVSGQLVTLEWRWDGEQNVEFEVRIRLKGDKKWQKLVRITGQNYEIPLSALEDQKEYEWQIVAIYKDKEYPSAIQLFKWE